jgi:DTW domain-containing protein YfiP
MELCICDARPFLELATHVLVIQHNRERHKPTNSARLLPQVLKHAEIFYYAVRDESFDESPLLDAHARYFVLFPGPESVELKPEMLSHEAGVRNVLVVLDGSWAQCSRMRSRIEALGRATRVRLPPGPPSSWGVRIASDVERVCSYEATIRALAICEGAEVVAPLDAFFREQSQRMLFMKGKAPPPWQRAAALSRHEEIERTEDEEDPT